jgi:hypothetical protein
MMFNRKQWSEKSNVNGEMNSETSNGKSEISTDRCLTFLFTCLTFQV